MAAPMLRPSTVLTALAGYILQTSALLALSAALLSTAVDLASRAVPVADDSPERAPSRVERFLAAEAEARTAPQVPIFRSVVALRAPDAPLHVYLARMEAAEPPRTDVEARPADVEARTRLESSSSAVDNSRVRGRVALASSNTRVGQASLQIENVTTNTAPKRGKRPTALRKDPADVNPSIVTTAAALPASIPVRPSAPRARIVSESARDITHRNLGMRTAGLSGNYY